MDWDRGLMAVYLVPVTRWALRLEEAPVIQTQEGASANVSSTDTTAISVCHSTGVCPMTWMAADHATATRVGLSITTVTLTQDSVCAGSICSVDAAIGSSPASTLLL